MEIMMVIVSQLLGPVVAPLEEAFLVVAALEELLLVVVTVEHPANQVYLLQQKVCFFSTRPLKLFVTCRISSRKLLLLYILSLQGRRSSLMISEKAWLFFYSSIFQPFFCLVYEKNSKAYMMIWLLLDLVLFLFA